MRTRTNCTLRLCVVLRYRLTGIQIIKLYKEKPRYREVNAKRKVLYRVSEVGHQDLHNRVQQKILYGKGHFNCAWTRKKGASFQKVLTVIL